MYYKCKHQNCSSQLFLKSLGDKFVEGPIQTRPMVKRTLGFLPEPSVRRQPCWWRRGAHLLVYRVIKRPAWRGWFVLPALCRLVVRPPCTLQYRRETRRKHRPSSMAGPSAYGSIDSNARKRYIMAPLIFR